MRRCDGSRDARRVDPTGEGMTKTDKLTARMHRLRETIGEWVAAAHPDLLEQSMEHCLGTRPRDRERIYAALAFALIAPPPDGDSPIERYDALGRDHGRLDRRVLAAWRDARFRLLEIRSVDDGTGFCAEDAVTGEAITVAESVGTTQLEAGDWLMGFVATQGDRHVLEGTAELIAPAGRAPVFHALQALATPDAPAPTTRRWAWTAMTAMHAAYVERPDGQTDAPATLSAIRDQPSS